MVGVGRIAIICLTAVAMVACLAPQNVEMVGVDMQSWSDVATIEYNNGDTLAVRHLNIAIRYNDNFKEGVLPLKVAVTTPDARYYEEEIRLPITHPRTALAVSTTESLPYRSSVVLSQKGEYIFAFTPLVEVRGVEAIGVDFREIAE